MLETVRETLARRQFTYFAAFACHEFQHHFQIWWSLQPICWELSTIHDPTISWFDTWYIAIFHRVSFLHRSVFSIPALLSSLGISSPFVLSCPRSSRTSLDATDAVKRQTSSCRAMDWPNYFPIDFLASRVAQDPHDQYRVSGFKPYASDSRGKLFCTQQSCNICSLHRQWDRIPLSHFVCLCLPFPP